MCYAMILWCPFHSSSLQHAHAHAQPIQLPVKKPRYLFPLLFLLLLHHVGPSHAVEIELLTSSVPLNYEDISQRTVGALVYRGGLKLSSNDERFGGFSALLISDDGRRLLAASDKGIWFSAELFYDADGNLSDASAARLAPITGTDGKPLSGRYRDAEALARATDGSVLLAFEQHHRILHFHSLVDLDAHALAASIPKYIPVPKELNEFNGNAALEGLVTLADGNLLLLTEGLDNERVGKPGWVLRDGTPAKRFEYNRSTQFRPTGAARLPDGDILVLERRFTLIGGVAALIKRVPQELIGFDARLEGTELVRILSPLTIDNMEGLAARRDNTGRTVIYLISDDNYSMLQRTLLLMFELKE